MNNYLWRFLAVMCFVSLATISCPLAAQQSAQPALAGVAACSANAQVAERAAIVAYSADEVTETTQTLADGTKITHRSLSKLFRDSHGRERTESFETQEESSGEDNTPFSITIHDPVARVTYILNTRNHLGQMFDFRKPTPPPPPQTAGTAAKPARPAQPRPTREDLGTQVIEGLEAKGDRVTTIIPEGAEGNDRPLQITRETWYATKENIVLLRISNDPRRGERVMRVTNLVLDEPPAELFQVPSDYAIQKLQPVTKPEPPSE